MAPFVELEMDIAHADALLISRYVLVSTT